MFKIKIKFIILMIAAFIFAYLQGGNLPYSVFYGFLLTFLIGLGFIMVHRKWLFVDIKFEKRIYSSGENDVFTMIVQNNSLIPAPYVTIKNKALTLINGRYNGDAISLSLDEGKMIKHEINFRTRGIYNFGEIQVSFKDLFCLFEVNNNLERDGLIKVYPKIYNIEKTILRGSDIFKNAVSNSSSIEDMYSMKDVRKYQDGDNLKRINWKVSAKYNDLYVRNYDTVSGQEFNIFLDMNEKNYELDGNGLMEEHMVDFCISLINYMVQKEIKTKLFINALTPGNYDVESKEDFDKVMENFLTQKSDGQFEFIKFINSNVHEIASLSGMGIVTGNVNERLTDYLMTLKDKGHNILLFYNMISPTESVNVSLLQKIGVECYNIEALLSKVEGTRN